MTMGFLSRGNDPVSIRQIDNGFVVSFEGRDTNGDWKTKEIYFKEFTDLSKQVMLYFEIKKD